MNTYFAKTILYGYAVLDDLIDQIDELETKKAILSINDTSPALFQCEKMVSLNIQKAVLFIVKNTVDNILATLSNEELLLLDYKYFKKRDRSEYVALNYLSRTYFRKQVKVASRFCEKLESNGIDEEFFKERCLSIDFFRNLLKIVIEKEVYSYKNKKLIDKNKQKEYDKKVNDIYKRVVA